MNLTDKCLHDDHCFVLSQQEASVANQGQDNVHPQDMRMAEQNMQASSEKRVKSVEFTHCKKVGEERHGEDRNEESELQCDIKSKSENTFLEDMTARDSCKITFCSDIRACSGTEVIGGNIPYNQNSGPRCRSDLVETDEHITHAAKDGSAQHNQSHLEICRNPLKLDLKSQRSTENTFLANDGSLERSRSAIASSTDTHVESETQSNLITRCEIQNQEIQNLTRDSITSDSCSFDHTNHDLKESLSKQSKEYRPTPEDETAETFSGDNVQEVTRTVPAVHEQPVLGRSTILDDSKIQTVHFICETTCDDNNVCDNYTANHEQKCPSPIHCNWSAAETLVRTISKSAEPSQSQSKDTEPLTKYFTQVIPPFSHTGLSERVDEDATNGHIECRVRHSEEGNEIEGEVIKPFTDLRESAAHSSSQTHFTCLENDVKNVSVACTKVDPQQKSESVHQQPLYKEASTALCSTEIRDEYDRKKVTIIKEHKRNIMSMSTDPYELSDGEDCAQKKYQPIKRKCNMTDLSSAHKSAKVSLSDNNLTFNDGVVLRTDHNAKDVLQPVLSNECQKAPRQVVYVHSDELLQRTNQLIRIEGRALLVHSLIRSFGLLQYLEVISPQVAKESEILGFHCPDYVRFLQQVKDEESSDPVTSESENYGLSYDCPLQEGIFETASLISGATITAAEQLINSTAQVAVNWYGGWHHAKRDTASGFCYINDIVLGILKLREKFDKILYIDLDLHHGDGVEEAFAMTSKVMTVSFHKHAPGFFPGSGGIEYVGIGRGKFYSVNVPLLDGIKDAEFFAVFCRVMRHVREKFPAQAVVVQCGADGLAQDPMASFNLTHVALVRCVHFVLSWNLPTLLLGGGGYNFPNTAKCWAHLTALAVGKKLPRDIPEHEHLLMYGPDYEMCTSAGNRKDCNTKEYLIDIIRKVVNNLNNL